MRLLPVELLRLDAMLELESSVLLPQCCMPLLLTLSAPAPPPE